jgi:predicted metalloprotease with PDZ domain
MTLARRPDGGGVEWLLAHELFHEWNGHAITLAQPKELAYWFSEGFTDFYARRLLFRAGRLDEEAYLASWNQKLAVQAANPARHAPAERVQEAFWSERDVGEVPYQRGDLIALLVDHAIRVRSGGARSLDDLMRELVRRARAGAGPFTNEALLAAIGELAGAETEAAVHAWAVDGLEPSLPEDAAGPEYALVPADLPTFDTGFDHEATLREGVVTGVRPGGCAEHAGLRDGMRLAGWSVNFGQVNQPIELSLREGGETRSLAYLPHGVPMRGYRLEKRAR